MNQTGGTSMEQMNEKKTASDQQEFQGLLFDGNKLIEEAVGRYHADSSDEHFAAVIDAIRQRMHEDGHFIIPVITDEEDKDRFSLRAIQTRDGKYCYVAFTSYAEHEQGQESEVISHAIDSTLKFILETEADGLIINPWGNPFLLDREMADRIIKVDGGVEYSVPEEVITAKLLEDGSFLKRAIEICNRNRTVLNILKLERILRDSQVWVPCTAIMSDADYAVMEKAIKDAEENGGLDSLVGMEFSNQDNIRMVPDILQNGDEYFFPVFTSEEEMGEYGERFSKVACHFLEAENMARNNERNVAGIVINAFTEPFVVPRELFDMIARIESAIEVQI